MSTRRGPGAQLPYRYIAGVEPCPAGWLVAGGRLQGVTLTPEEPVLYPTFAEVIDQRPSFEIIALHAPIGLLDESRPGGRACDRAARRVLGWPRLAAVTPAPLRPALAASSWEDAVRRNDGMSPVTWALLDHVREVAEEMQPYRQRQVFETHPELAFLELNGGGALRHSRHRRPGREERATLLRSKLQGADRILGARLRDVRREHLLDAAADLWTARRIAARSLKRLPETPEWDSEGLRMEVVY